MTVDVRWADIAHEFEPDGGTLLDIYVGSTAADDWQRVLDLIRSRYDYPSFLVDGEPAALPATIDEIFALKNRASPSLAFTVRSVRFVTHFFTLDEIELDVRPAEVRGPHELEAIAMVLEALAHGTGKVASLTPENMPEKPILTCDPTSRGIVYQGSQ